VEHAKVPVAGLVVWLTVAVAGCNDSEEEGPPAPQETCSDSARQETSKEFPDWSFYGRDFCNSRANLAETKITPQNVSTLVEKWSFTEDPATPAVTSTPVIFEDTLYFGDWNSRVQARDPRTGEKRYEATALLDPPGGLNQVNHTPFVTKDYIYAGSHAAELFKLDRATGQVLNRKILDDQPGLLLWSSPIVVEGVVIIGIGSYQVFVGGAPAFKGSVVGVDAEALEPIWRLPLAEGSSGVSVWSTAAVDTKRKLAFIGTGQQYAEGGDTPYSDSLIAFEYLTGALRWNVQYTAGDRFQVSIGGGGGPRAGGPDHDVGASPNLFTAAGEALVGVGDKAGRYHVHNRDTGDKKWSRDLTPGGANGGVMASAAYASGVIYVVSNDGTSGGAAGVGGGPGRSKLFALEAASGNDVWGPIDLTPGTFGALAVTNGILFVPTLAGELRAFDTSNGALLLSKPHGQSMGGGISISGGMVFAGHGWTWLPPSQGGLVAYGLP
jgi:polyvinyl alcohol dehydrogenase (cytochrome)